MVMYGLRVLKQLWQNNFFDLPLKNLKFHKDLRPSSQCIIFFQLPKGLGPNSVFFQILHNFVKIPLVIHKLICI